MGGPGPAAKGIDTTGAAVEPGAAERLRVSGHRAAARAGAEGRGATGGKERGREERRKGRREGGGAGGALAGPWRRTRPLRMRQRPLTLMRARRGPGRARGRQTDRRDRQTGQTG